MHRYVYFLIFGLFAIGCKKNPQKKSIVNAPKGINLNYLAGEWDLIEYEYASSYYPGGGGAPYYLRTSGGYYFNNDKRLKSWHRYWVQDKDTPGVYDEVYDTASYKFQYKIQVSVSKDTVLTVDERYEHFYIPTSSVSAYKNTMPVNQSKFGSYLKLKDNWYLLGDTVILYNVSASSPQGGHSQSPASETHRFRRKK